MHMLRKTLASLFRKKGLMPIKRSDLVFFASMDLRWFTPSQARQIVRVSLAEGLLDEENDELKIVFDCSDIKPELDFRPDVDTVMEELGVSDRKYPASEEGRETGTSPDDGDPGKTHARAVEADIPGSEDDGESTGDEDAGMGGDDVPQTAGHTGKVSRENAGPTEETSRKSSTHEHSRKKRELLMEIISRITEETKLEKRHIVARSNRVKAKFGSIDMAAAALVVAREYRVEIDDLLKRAEDLLLKV